jgi:hypothetical protein
MRKILVASCVLVLSIGWVVARPADDAANPRAVIEKAIKAMGGAEKLSRFKAATFKTKGKFSGLGQPVEFTADVTVQLPKQRMAISKFDISGMVRTMTETVNGATGWMHVRGKVQDMPAVRLAQQQQELYSTWVATILPLQDPAFKLSPVPESKANDRPVLGIKVTHEGEPDVTIYFDKESGLPAKSVIHGKERGGKEEGLENYYSDYIDIDGIKVYTKLLVKRGGKTFVEIEFSDFKLMEKLDNKVFAKPADD